MSYFITLKELISFMNEYKNYSKTVHYAELRQALAFLRKEDLRKPRDPKIVIKEMRAKYEDTIQR